MGLQIWLPLNGNLDNQGLSDVTITNSGATVNDSGKIGKCYYFDGTTSMQTTYSTAIGTGDFSIAMWIKIPTLTSATYYAICTSKTTAAASAGFGIYWNHSQKKFLWSTADGSGATEIWMTTAVDSIVYDKWIHLVMVRNSNDAKKGYFYINNTRYELASVPAIRNITTDTKLRLGKTTNGSYPVKMYLNDFRIYDYALSPEEIKELSRGLILHYPLSGPIEHQVFGDAIEDKETYLIRRTPGYNLINNLYAAGRTTVNNNTVTALLSQNADTYFHFSCSEPLIAGEKYTLSMYCSGFPSSDNYLDWGIIAQNSGKNIRMKNGYCKATFSPNSNIAANTKIIVDDIGRGSSGYQDITITDIKLEKGEVETPWIEKNSEFDQIVGGSVAWNQRISINTYFSTYASEPQLTKDTTNNAFVFSGKIRSDAKYIYLITSAAGATKDHVYFISFKVTATTLTPTHVWAKADNQDVSITKNYIGDGYYTYISKATKTTPGSFIFGTSYINSNAGDSFAVSFKDVMEIDLTLMFGPTIADYILSLENTTAGNGVAWFRNYFPKDYYPYCAPTMKSVTGLISHNTTGFNLFDEVWESGQVNRTTGANESYSGRSRSKNYIPVLPGMSYYYTSLATYFVYYDSGKNCIGTSNGGFVNPGIITMPANAAFVRFTVNTSTPSDYDYCFNISNFAKNGTYEPYVGRSYALDSNVVLRGFWKLDTNDNNKLYCDGDVYSGDGSIVRNYKQVILDGTTNKFNGVFGATNNGYCAYISTGLLGTRTSNVICDRFVYSNKSYTEMPLYGFCSSSGANETWSFILPSTVTSLAEANTWLTNNPTTIVVKLATPTTETATPFSNPQVCSIEGIEEYVIAEQDGVVIPAGHQTKYLRDVLEGRYHTYEEAVSGMGIDDNVEYDVSGYKRNGVKTNVNYSSNRTKLMYSSIFDGTTSYIETDTPDGEVTTISIWVKTTWTSSSGYRFAVHDKHSGLGLGWAGSNIIVYVGPSEGGAGSAVSNSGYKANEWNHIVVVKTGQTTRTVYINGVQASNNSNNWWAGDMDTKMFVGTRHINGAYAGFFDGELSDFRVYATLLSASDVAELYNAGVTT